MPKGEKKYISDKIIEKAKEFGACLAGIASVEALKNSPSHFIYGKIDEYKGVGTKETDTIKPREVTWPEKAKAAIIIAVEHPEEKPELDWWQDGYRGGTAGNEILMFISDKLSAWLEEKQGIKTNKLPYYIEYGGIFLKDAAVMAGLGCIGKNNLLVTREFGPRVRMRAMFTHEILPGTEPTDFYPCEDCHVPCRRVCPQEAFRGEIASAEQFGLSKLPGRTGVYSRHLCNIQMELDVANSEKIIVRGRDELGRLIRYCRRCELACPVGQAE